MHRKLDELRLFALPGMPLVAKGDDVGSLTCEACKSAGVALEDGDIIVIASKVISKSEGRTASLKGVSPGARARRIAEASGKDPRTVELMLRESEKVLGVSDGIVETLHKLGFVCTSAGIDSSNVGRQEEEMVSLLPTDPDASAARIRRRINALTGKKVGVVVNDSFGIKYRKGSIGLAVGLSGIPAMIIGGPAEKDLYGKPRGVGISIADEIAAAASMLMGQSDRGVPAVVVRGLKLPEAEGRISDLTEADRVRKDYKGYTDYDA